MQRVKPDAQPAEDALRHHRDQHECREQPQPGAADASEQPGHAHAREDRERRAHPRERHGRHVEPVRVGLVHHRAVELAER
jgi:hypothetical protein